MSLTAVSLFLFRSGTGNLRPEMSISLTHMNSHVLNVLPACPLDMCVVSFSIRMMNEMSYETRDPRAKRPWHSSGWQARLVFRSLVRTFWIDPTASGRNMPATQLQVAMGIPLERMPQIRNFYGLPEKDGKMLCHLMFVNINLSPARVRMK